MADEFDAVIVGAGQAGPPLADRLSRAGETVAIIERKLVGGTCVNYGCIPTKALVASARAAHMTRRSTDFGVHFEGDVRVDMQQVHDRMQLIAGESRENVQKWIHGMENTELIRGHAKFRGPGELEVDGRKLRAEKVFINVGGRARVPDIDGLDEVEYLTNHEMLELTEVPEHLVIVGGSYIGLEFGQMFRRFGSGVTIVEMGDRLIRKEDPDVSEAVLEIVRNEGIDVRLRSECIAVEPHERGVRVKMDCTDEEKEVVGTHLLVATGRVPNTDELGLENAGVETDERGFVVVDDQLRTTCEGVWAMGDCNGEGAFTHTSYNDFEIVAANLLDGEERRVSDRFVCYALFIDPPLGRVGLTETQAREQGYDVRVGRRSMSRVGRARERSETQGFMKVIVDAATDRILGGAVLGVNGDEVIHVLMPAMYADAPYTVISKAVHIHPTVAELLPTVLQDLR